METFALGRQIRDYIIPHIRKKYHITGQYLSLAAAAEVIQVVRLGLLAAGVGELTEEQLSELGTILEPEVHQQLRPKSGGKKAVVLEIERLWSERPAAHATQGVPHSKAAGGVKKVAIVSFLGMLLGIGLAKGDPVLKAKYLGTLAGYGERLLGEIHGRHLRPVAREVDGVRADSAADLQHPLAVPAREVGEAGDVRLDQILARLHLVEILPGTDRER